MCEASKTTKADFEEFWKEVSPKKKKAKKLAKEAYIKAVKEISKDHDDPHAFLRDRIRAYFASELGKTRFANSPAPWLNQGHYDDDPESWKTNEGKPTQVKARVMTKEEMAKWNPHNGGIEGLEVNHE